MADIFNLTKALEFSWSAETMFDPADWSPENPARGQCLVSSLVVQHYLGGELVRFAVTGDGINETHHCNLLPDGKLLDATASQYDTMDVAQKLKPSDTKDYSSLRERYLADEYDRSRYEKLKAKVDEYMANKERQQDEELITVILPTITGGE